MNISDLKQKVVLLANNKNIKYGSTECTKFIEVMKVRAAVKPYMRSPKDEDERYYVSIRNINVGKPISAIKWEDHIFVILSCISPFNAKFTTYVVSCMN